MHKCCLVNRPCGTGEPRLLDEADQPEPPQAVARAHGPAR
jgi:hypothetical protein